MASGATGKAGPKAGPIATDVTPPAQKDPPVVDSDGNRLAPLIEGVEIIVPTRITDHRGSLTEVITGDSGFWREPIIYSYALVINPGRIKGWGMHRIQADRVYLAAGQIRTVLHDGRVDSPTYGTFSTHYSSDANPQLIRIPPGVWHAHQNFTESAAVAINFPTAAFNHANPDKYRIDPASGEIDFDFTLRDG